MLHVGDHDPSGVAMFDNLERDVLALFLDIGGDPTNPPTFERVAVTPAQADEYDAPSAPPKASDSRTASWDGPTWQAEAIPPTALAEIMREAAEAHVDFETLDEVLTAEAEIQEALAAFLRTKLGDDLPDVSAIAIPA